MTETLGSMSACVLGTRVNALVLQHSKYQLARLCTLLDG